MPKPSVFRDEQLQKAFDENGFVKFRMFSAEQVGKLHDFYMGTKDAHETVADQKKFHATNETDNASLISDSDAFIKQVMFEELDKHFKDYKTIAANYLIKQPHEASELLPHQDLRFVDEAKYYSFNIWVATEPTTPGNGCLRFLRGSHLLHDTIRVLPSYPWKYGEVSHLISQYFTDVQTEVGECVVLNHACIHASYPNLSGHIRVAAILALIPEGAQIYHYFLPEGNIDNPVEQYKMALQDFIELKGGQRPQNAELVQTFHDDFSTMNTRDFNSWLEKTQHKQPKQDGRFKNILSRLFKRS